MGFKKYKSIRDFQYIKAENLIKESKHNEAEMLAELSTFVEVLKDKGIRDIDEKVKLAVDLALTDDPIKVFAENIANLFAKHIKTSSKGDIKLSDILNKKDGGDHIPRID